MVNGESVQTSRTSTRPIQRTLFPTSHRQNCRCYSRAPANELHGRVLMHPGDQEKTSFMASRGTYCYKVMPFSLKNAGSTYQRVVNMMFADQIGLTMEVYIDDMLVKSLKVEDHISHLQQAFSTLRKYSMKLNPAKCMFGVSSGKFLGCIMTHRGIEANPKQILAIPSIPSPRNVKEVQRLARRMAALSRFISRLSDKSNAFFETLKNPKDFQWMEKCESVLRELKVYLTTPLLSKPLAGEALLLYLAVPEHSVSAVLVRDKGNRQLPIYYVSKALLDAEASSSPDGRRPQAKTPSSCYHHKITGPSRLCGRVLAYLTLGSGAGAEEGKWTLYVDGSRNVRGARVGIVLTSPSGNTASRAVRCNFKATNNESEYEALIVGLTLTHTMGAENIQVFRDSQLIINQVKGEYQAKDDSMIRYLAISQRLLKKFRSNSPHRD
ncbi:hypothetical protein Bca4012_065498 [Brassica carinata]